MPAAAIAMLAGGERAGGAEEEEWAAGTEVDDKKDEKNADAEALMVRRWSWARDGCV